MSDSVSISNVPMCRMFRWVNGVTILPSRYYFDDNCKNDHAVQGKIVRRKSTRECIICERRRYAQRKAKKDFPRNSEALHLYEDKLISDDVDPLFDGAA